MNTYSNIIDRFITWGKMSDKLQAAFIIGSQARADHCADKFSDLDIIMIVEESEYFLFSNQWLENIGEHHVSFIENTADGGKERRVLFDNALDVDFVILPKSVINESIKSTQTAALLSRGYRILIDKIGIEQAFSQIPNPKPYTPPSENEFQNLVNDFWYHSVWTTKKLLRGELWAAKSCMDCYMKWRLLSIIEWYTHATNSQFHDTWHDGRFLDEWANDWITSKLSDVFAHYNKEDIKRALLSTMDLFRLIAIEVAEKLTFEYPEEADEFTSAWVKTSLQW